MNVKPKEASQTKKLLWKRLKNQCGFLHAVGKASRRIPQFDGGIGPIKLIPLANLYSLEC